jgi:hypothetical protein
MSKWLITVADKDDKAMKHMEKTANNVWVREAYGEEVEVQDMQKMED